MANKTISELTNAALPLAGTDKTIVSRDGVTLNDVLLSDLKSYIGTSGFVSTAFSTTLSFDGVNKEMIQQAVTGALAFISSGSTLGTQINMCLVANGTNVPTFATNFKEATGSSGYDNTANVKNYFQFIYSNNRVLYSTFQEVGDTGVVETLPVNTVAPVLSAVTVGGALSCTNGTWTGNPTPTYTQQFKLDGVNIASNYTVVSGDVGKVVTCVVTATNTVGAVNATSNSQTVAASATAPAQVTGLTLGTPTSTTQPLTWTAPSNGGSAITDYLVEYKATSSGTWLTFSDGTSTTASATVTGLTASTSYDYRVSAINAIGTGTASATGTGSTTSAAAPLLLLHMDGTNGSTTFTDSSTFGRTVTPNGGADITTAESVFGGASANLVASGRYLELGTQSDFNFTSNVFTIEFWTKQTSTATNARFVTTGLGSTTTGSFIIGNFTAGFGVVSANNHHFTVTTAEFTPIATMVGVWTHIRVVANGTTISLYRDGVRVGNSATLTGQPININAGNFTHIGREIAGTGVSCQAYIDEFAIWNVALNTGNFTPPVAPY